MVKIVTLQYDYVLPWKMSPNLLKLIQINFVRFQWWWWYIWKGTMEVQWRWWYIWKLIEFRFWEGSEGPEKVRAQWHLRIDDRPTFLLPHKCHFARHNYKFYL